MGIEINMDGSFFYDKPNPINFFLNLHYLGLINKHFEIRDKGDAQVLRLSQIV